MHLNVLVYLIKIELIKVKSQNENARHAAQPIIILFEHKKNENQLEILFLQN